RMSSEKTLQAQYDAQEFERMFAQIVKDLTERDLHHAEIGDAVARLKQVIEYNSPGGKRNRGLSVVASFRELARPDQQNADNHQRALVVGWCVELLQAFFLVADDIMDASITRRGQPCWYKKEGVGLDAINDSFLLEASIYRLLKKYCKGQPYYFHLLELFLEASYQTELGQALDLMTAPPNEIDLSRFTESRYKAIVKYKTAFYSFYLPVAAAMYMAGIEKEAEHNNAKTILLEMGEFFQIQENYGKNEQEKVAKVKALYEDLDLKVAYREYEEQSYQRLMALINRHAGNLSKDVFMLFAQKIYKRQNSCSDFESDATTNSICSKELPLSGQSNVPRSIFDFKLGSWHSLPLSSGWMKGRIWMGSREWTLSQQAVPLVCLQQKRGLLNAVSSSVDKIVSHFSTTRNLVQKAQLGDSRISPEVGHLVLQGLCPALYAIVGDELKPYQNDLIVGRRKNSPWHVVEASVKPGPSTKSLYSLYCKIHQLSQLSNSKTRFNAFIFGLLNVKQLDFWISHLKKCTDVLAIHYSPTAFLSLTEKPFLHLFEELLLLLQPLSVFTFSLDLLFEYHHHFQVDFEKALANGSLQTTLHQVRQWGDKLANTLMRNGSQPVKASKEAATGKKPASWWEQLSETSRVYVSPKQEGFLFAKWIRAKSPTSKEGTHSEAYPRRSPATEEPKMWLGRLFGANSPSSKGSPDDPEMAYRPRRPSSWLAPNVNVFDFMHKGSASEKEKSSPPQPTGCALTADPAVKALCDHASAEEEHLSFKKGDVLQVLSSVDEDWIRCCHGDEVGLVPIGYTSIIL
uniref:Farnesyl pyrophosphate synthase n=1 Tax=Latimeria chalumnae TaxID=7897 RepID=H3AQ66_LATCH